MKHVSLFFVCLFLSILVCETSNGPCRSHFHQMECFGHKDEHCNFSKCFETFEFKYVYAIKVRICYKNKTQIISVEYGFFISLMK